MKRFNVSSHFKFITIFTVLLLGLPMISCTGESGADNQFLGKFPAIAQKYDQLIEAKKEEARTNTNMDDAFKMAKEEQLLKDEKKAKIEEYLQNNPLQGKVLPFQPLPGTHYTVDQVVINLAQPGNLNLKFTATINEVKKSKYGSVSRRLRIYYKAVDAAGNEISNTKTVAINTQSPRKIEPGTKIESYGSWTGSKLAQLSDFAKVVEITQEEYKAK